MPMMTDIERKVVDLLTIDKFMDAYAAFWSNLVPLEDEVSISSATKKELVALHRKLRAMREALIKEICDHKKKEIEMVELTETWRYEDEDEGRVELDLDIMQDGKKVGTCHVIDRTDGSILERIDIDDEYRGIGSEVIRLLSADRNRLFCAADSERSARLYARIGSEWDAADDARTGSNWSYLDQGYGVYRV